MKVLITGVKGQLGYDVARVLKEKNIEYLGTDRQDLDITMESDVLKFIRNYQPTHLIHCAAYTAVDKAEDDKEMAYKINVLGTKYLAAAAKSIHAKFVYISTDYVFDGLGDIPFAVTAKPNPKGYYGLTKYQGELEVQSNLDKYYIVRISWIFGINGNNFVKTMLRLAETNLELNVVSDQIGSPTYTYDLAYLLYDLIQIDSFGIYHATNEGYCSWYDLAVEIFRQAKVDIKVHPILSKDYPTKAIRPLNSRMITNFKSMRSWKDALHHYLKELGVI